MLDSIYIGKIQNEAQIPRNYSKKKKKKILFPIQHELKHIHDEWDIKDSSEWFDCMRILVHEDDVCTNVRVTYGTIIVRNARIMHAVCRFP